jgi:single-stranded DNA-binding protein
MGKSGFEFSGSGRLGRIDTFTTKAGKDIVTLVLQVEGTYPQLVPIKTFGRLADEAAALTVGDVVEVTGHLGGRDWNGKVYPDIIGETLEVVASTGEGEDKPAARRGWGDGQQQQVPGTSGAGKHSEAKASDPLPAGYVDDDIPF